MSKFNKPARPILMLLASAYLALQFGAIAAEARDTRQRQGHTRAQGDYSRESQVQRTDTGFTRSSTATNAQGQTATRDATVVNDADAGTRSRTVTATGFNGETRTITDELRRTEDGYARQKTVTHPSLGANQSTRDQ